MRAIDGDALIEFIENRYVITWKDDYEGGIKYACTDILEKISKMPTIEPERKKGKWIPQDHNKHHGMISTTVYYFPRCSACGESANYTNFCPNCGADMREDQDG